MSILYLTYDGLNDPLGQSQILPYLEGLAIKGHEITVISFEKSRKLKVESSRLKVVPLQYHKSPPVLSTLYDLYFLRKTVKKVLKSYPIDIIHCRSYITSLVGLWAKRKYGIKFIFDMRGFWADERVEGGLWNLNNPVFKRIYHFFKRKEKEFINAADSIVSLTENAKHEILQRQEMVVQDEKISVIPTCVDLKLFDSKAILNTKTEMLKEELGIAKGDFVLLYLGSVGTWYMLDEMLDFFEELQVKMKNLKGVSSKFLFLTNDQAVLKEKLHARTNTQNIIIRQAYRINVPAYITLCQAGIFFIKPSFSKKASSATKMGEFMAMGKPIITNAGWGDVDSIINAKNGVLVKKFNTDSYHLAIEELIVKDNYDPTLIRADAEKYYSLKKGIDQYDSIYKKLTTG